MREYAKVAPQFWTGETGKKLRALGSTVQVVALYLLTCPSANMLGLYYLPLPTLCHETGSPFEGASEALRSLSEGGFARYDEASEHVWVMEMAKFQIGESLSPKDNRHKAVIKELEGLRKSPFFNDFVEKYRDAFALHEVVSAKPLRSPFEAPSKPLRSQEQEQEQEKEQTGGTPSGAPPALALVSPSIPEPRKPRKGHKSAKATMAEFIAQCKELGEDQIAERDAVWTYAESAGIPDECIKLAWAEFKARHIDTQTRYSNWRRAFQNCVRGNWYRLWAIDESAQCVLTSAGRQARKVHGGPKAA